MENEKGIMYARAPKICKKPSINWKPIKTESWNFNKNSIQLLCTVHLLNVLAHLEKVKSFSQPTL